MTNTTESSAPKTKRKTINPRPDEPRPGEPLVLTYTLSEMPSAQHRAGLAGLVYLIRFLKNKGCVSGCCEIVDCGASSATLRLDRLGVGALFDELYAATVEEKRFTQQRKDRFNEPIPPIRTETEEEGKRDGGKGKAATKIKTYYVYPVVVPKADFLQVLEPQRDRNGPWLKLWRDMLWSILRGIPTTRGPYEDRAAGLVVRDADKAFAQLCKQETESVPLSSTMLLGTQSVTAENVAFRDRVRFEFLLHFWPIIGQVYVPQVWNVKDNKREFLGYVVAIPDVALLDSFLAAFVRHMQERTADRDGFRPKAAVIDLTVEAGLDLSLCLSNAVSALEGQSRPKKRAVLSVDVFHVNKEGNNVRLLGCDRVTPTTDLLGEYGRFKNLFWDHIYRRQRLLNLVKQRPWFFGFDTLMQTLPCQHFLPKTEPGKPPPKGNFSRDVHKTFVALQKEKSTMNDPDSNTPSKPGEQDQLSQIVYGLARNYVERKVETKKKNRPENEKELRERISREAFLAVRSRSGADFVEYFCGTLCSVPQGLSRDRFQTVGRALRDEEGRAALRTLTLLALSAIGFTGFGKERPTDPAPDTKPDPT